MTRNWDLKIRWNPDSFSAKPHFKFKRVKFAKGWNIDCGWLSLLINLETWDHGKKEPKIPPIKCDKGCPYPRDAGACLRKQGVPGAGGSFGDYCECDCHLPAGS